MNVNADTTIRRFFDALAMVANGPYLKINASEISAMETVRRLKDQGLVTWSSATLNGTLYDLDITPSGAITLAQWGEFLKKRSIRGRVLDAVDRLVWALVGSLTTVAGVVLQNFLNG